MQFKIMQSWQILLQASYKYDERLCIVGLYKKSIRDQCKGLFRSPPEKTTEKSCQQIWQDFTRPITAIAELKISRDRGFDLFPSFRPRFSAIKMRCMFFGMYEVWACETSRELRNFLVVRKFIAAGVAVRPKRDQKYCQ